MPRTMEEMNDIATSKIVSPKDSHLIKVAVIGVPNSGKSTLVNALINWKVIFMCFFIVIYNKPL